MKTRKENASDFGKDWLQLLECLRNPVLEPEEENSYINGVVRFRFSYKTKRFRTLKFGSSITQAFGFGRLYKVNPYDGKLKKMEHLEALCAKIEKDLLFRRSPYLSLFQGDKGSRLEFLQRAIAETASELDQPLSKIQDEVIGFAENWDWARDYKERMLLGLMEPKVNTKTPKILRY